MSKMIIDVSCIHCGHVSENFEIGEKKDTKSECGECKNITYIGMCLECGAKITTEDTLKGNFHQACSNIFSYIGLMVPDVTYNGLDFVAKEDFNKEDFAPLKSGSNIKTILISFLTLVFFVGIWMEDGIKVPDLSSVFNSENGKIKKALGTKINSNNIEIVSKLEKLKGRIFFPFKKKLDGTYEGKNYDICPELISQTVFVHNGLLESIWHIIFKDDQIVSVFKIDNIGLSMGQYIKIMLANDNVSCN
tara:strand:- start:28 stop:771 length:744 start_codon:yes stop_codon:yes gene_type:complete